jgi:hypothetical protein
MDYEEFLRLEGGGGGSSSSAAAAAAAASAPKRPRGAPADAAAAGERAAAKAAAAAERASAAARAREAARAAREAGRALEAAGRAAQKEASKQAKSLAAMDTQVGAGRFSGAEVALEMSGRLAGSALGQMIAAEAAAVTGRVKFGEAAGSLEALFVLPPPAEEPLSEAPSLRWRRGVVRAAGEGGGGGGPAYAFPNPTLKRALPLEVDFSGAPAEPVVAIVLPGEAWVALALRLGTAGLVRWLRARAAELPPGTDLAVLTHGVTGAVAKAVAAAAAAGRGRPFPPHFSMDALHAHAFVACGVRVTHYPAPAQLVEQVLRLSRFLGARAYREEDSALLVVARAKADTAWLKMLKTLPGVSDKVAAAISRRFPSLRALMDAYAEEGVPEREKAALLEGVMLGGGEEGEGAGGEGGEGGGGGKGGGKKLTKMSADVYAFFTAADPAADVFKPK